MIVVWKIHDTRLADSIYAFGLSRSHSHRMASKQWRGGFGFLPHHATIIRLKVYVRTLNCAPALGYSWHVQPLCL